MIDREAKYEKPVHKENHETLGLIKIRYLTNKPVDKRKFFINKVSSQTYD